MPARLGLGACRAGHVFLDRLVVSIIMRRLVPQKPRVRHQEIIADIYLG